MCRILHRYIVQNALKNLKKIFAAVLALCMLLCFVGCGTNDTNSEADGKKVLTMATNAEFPPYEYHEGDKIVGIDAEVAAAIAEKLGMELEIADVDFDSIIPGVQQGKYDMGMAGMTVTEDRLKSVNFSTTYATGIQVIIVKEGSEITSPDDMAAKADLKIGVQQDTTGDIYASDKLEKWGFTSDRVTKFKTGADAVEALKAGKIMAVIIDNEPAKSFVAANEGLKIMEASYAEEEYAICVAKENTELRDKINTALKELIADGTVQKIIDKYIPAEAE